MSSSVAPPAGRLSPADLLLLAALTVCWGFNWPIMKLGVRDMAPLYYRSVCIAGGLAVLWAWARVNGLPLALARRHWRQLAWLALFNTIIWHVLAIVAIRLLPAGRSALLGYTMPVWAVLFGVVVFRERVSRVHWVGVAAALGGTVLLLASELTALAGRPLGTVLMLVAAAAWGFGTHLLRRHLTEVPTLVVAFWMLACALVVMTAGTVAFERDAWRLPDAVEAGSMAYNMVLAIAFCHVAWSSLARRLPAAASGLSVMLIPVVGVFSSMLLIGERPGTHDWIALLLMLVALSTVLMAQRPAVTITSPAD
jgi:drug/metabolite transporter (DMT)-like permease